MRGTQPPAIELVLLLGIIPAYAGNTGVESFGQIQIGDHPRVCGEHIVQLFAQLVQVGSSPRMRGTLAGYAHHFHAGGIIPAYAGNTLRDYSNFVVSKFMSFVFHLV